MDRAKFFTKLRGSLYIGGVSQSAVATLDAILDETDGKGIPAPHAAYMMATAYHEVGRPLKPIRESLNYSVSSLLTNFSRRRISENDAHRLGRKTGERIVPLPRQKEIANIIYGGAWGRDNLGNIEPNDGWTYRGGGLPQTTGRANFAKVSKLVGVNLVAAPERIVEIRIAVIALVRCMIEGTYTGKKLSDYNLPAQFAAARAIINADVKKNGGKIAVHAQHFLAALDAGGYSAQRTAPERPPVIDHVPMPHEELEGDTHAPAPTIPAPAPEKPSGYTGIIAIIAIIASAVAAFFGYGG